MHSFNIQLQLGITQLYMEGKPRANENVLLLDQVIDTNTWAVNILLYFIPLQSSMDVRCEHITEQLICNVAMTFTHFLSEVSISIIMG